MTTSMPIPREVQVQEAVGRLVPGVTDLVRRAAGTEPRVASLSPSHVRVAAELTFPDGIGRGTVAVGVFRYRGALRIDLAVEHNRVFAGRDGSASENRCYLNDYVASVTLGSDAAELPVEFVRKVVSGVAAARTAVERYRRRSSGWFHVEITTAPIRFAPSSAGSGRPALPSTT